MYDGSALSGSFRAKTTLALSFGVLVASVAPRAGAQTRRTVRECIADFERAQHEQASGMLHAARSSANRCIDASCPAPIRKDCESLAEDVGRAIPTLIFRVRDPADADVLEATITLDGAVVPGAVDGRPREVDPGPHEIAATASGFETVRTKIVAEEGVHPRIVELHLRPSPSASTASSEAAARAAPRASAAEGPAPTRPAPGTWIASGTLAAVGVIGLGVFAGFGLDADSDYRHLRDTCHDACPRGDVDSVRSRFQVADVALVTGVVALAAAVVVYLSGPRLPTATSTHGAF